MSPAPSHDPQHPSPSRGGDAEAIDLGALLAVLLDSWKLILAAILACVIVAVGYILKTSPVYHADSLIQIESKTNVLDGMKEMTGLISSSPETDTEIEIIRSRSVLGPVIDQLKLDLSAAPKHFPLIGAAIARSWVRDHSGVSPARLWLGRYGWGGERISLDRIDLPPELRDRALTLIAGEGGSYRLLDPNGGVLIEGKVGETTRNERVSMFVSELRARPGTEFTVLQRNRMEVFAALRAQVTIAEQGKDTGIIALSAKGPNPPLLVKTLDAIDNTFLRQNVERKSAEANKTLAFVESQLPELKAKLDTAEEALNAYQSESGAVDMDLETKSLLDKGVDVDSHISQLQLQRAELLQRFTAQHPAVITLDEQIAELQKKKDSVNASIKALPTTALKSVQLMRDVRVANDMYLLLLNKAQELKVVKSGTIGNVRILDPAIADSTHPVWPKPAFMLFAAIFLGLTIGAGLALARQALNRGVEDPDVLEAMGLPVYATVPYSEKQQRLLAASRKSGSKRNLVLAELAPGDMAIESIRSLRTSLQFSLAESKRNVLLLTGLRPEVGKSFLSANLAVVMASAGKRVLLIDGDIRRGVTHTYFGLERGPGFSEVLSGSVPLEQAIRTTSAPNVSILTTGQLPPNPSELLLSDRFQAVVSWAEKNFELILIDSPPILAVTDAAILAKVAGVRLMVLKAGLHPPTEIALGLARFEQNGVRIHGAVFNSMRRRSNAYAYGKYGYQYQYEYKANP